MVNEACRKCMLELYVRIQYWRCHDLEHWGTSPVMTAHDLIEHKISKCA